MAALDDVLAKIADGTFAANDAESLEVEFKTDGRSRNDDLANLADAAACLANASGGTIIVGVDDRITGQDAFLGTTLDPEKTRLRIYELTSPPILVEAELRTTPRGDVLVVNVSSSTQVHSANSKIPTERIDKHCMPMTSDRSATVIAQKTGRDWSAQPSRVAAADLDPVAIQVAREMLAGSNDVSKRRLSEATDIDLLRAVGVVLEDQTLTNAGALLLAVPMNTRPCSPIPTGALQRVSSPQTSNSPGPSWSPSNAYSTSSTRA